jgi:hypothetical protein
VKLYLYPNQKLDNKKENHTNGGMFLKRKERVGRCRRDVMKMEFYNK